MAKDKKEKPKRCVFYMTATAYCTLRSKLVAKGKSVSEWIREKIEAELAK